MYKGKLITFEGGEGSGKSTQLARLAKSISATGAQVVTTREPGGTQGAEFIRNLVLSPEYHWSTEAELLLHFAARADHLSGVIIPALESGAWVLCDRFHDSTLAYQGYGQGVELDHIKDLIEKISLKPSLTLILDVTEGVARSRLLARGFRDDRYDQMGPAFHARVAEGFKAIAAAEPDRCILIDANPDAATVAQTILAAVSSRLS